MSHVACTNTTFYMLPAEIQKFTWYIEKHNMSQVTFRNTTCYISYAQWKNTPSCMLNAHKKHVTYCMQKFNGL